MLLALGVLAAVAAAHPGLRLVDFLAFSVRARALPAADALVNPLYPLGYPALLALLQPVAGDVLLVGKVLALLAGVLAVVAAGRWLGAAAGLWLLVQAGLLTHAATEGTDLPAVALVLAGLAAAQRGRPGASGALLALACLVRYTAVAGLPAALLLAPRRRLRLLLAFGLATAPHWAVALATGQPVLPDQTVNLVISQGAPDATLLSWQTLERWPGGVARAWHAATLGWPTLLGAVGLLVGLLRRQRAAAALALLAGAHLALVGLAFANTRLVLPATLALALGARWLLPRPFLALLALGLGVTTVPLAREASTTEAAIHEVVAACSALPGPLLATSPWVYQRDGGWLRPSTPVQGLGPDTRGLEPAGLRLRALEHGYQGVIVDSGRVRRTYPALDELVRERPPPGLELACEAGSFKGYRVLPDAGSGSGGVGEGR